MILESVEHGPLIWPTVKDNGVIRTKKYAELSVLRIFQADCEMKATKINLQGRPNDIYSLERECFVAPVFSLGDDLIAYLNKAMSFLIVFKGKYYKWTGKSCFKSTTAKGWRNIRRKCTQPKRSRNAALYKEKAMLAEAQEAGQILDEEQLVFLTDLGIPADQVQTIIPHNVPNSETCLNDMNIQSVHALQDFEQSPVMDFTNNEISKLSAEQAFWFHILNPSIESSFTSPVIVEVPSELPKVVQIVLWIMRYGEYQLWEHYIQAVFYVEGLVLICRFCGNFVMRDLEVGVSVMPTICLLSNASRLRVGYGYRQLSSSSLRFLKTKDEAPAAIIKCIKNIQVRLKATVQNVRTDNGTEFVNQTLREWYENVGISHQTSVARTPQQNGVVERRNRTLVEAARTMLIFSKAPLFLWAKAINTACYTQNHSLIRLR
ncbi:retrovirus-related pol polyprotein from transposon TNT 1-94 [Tanacetum coccineum]|uniref:Retrovirus-related pol polyprotein from transposon TNT 1-94 n=1 Tax=Tanacetum coccineum TaxID=301880 RepID=A0ABQ5HKU8_9ASTR